MAGQRHRVPDDERVTPSPAAVLAPAAGLVALLLVVALLVSPSALLVRVTNDPQAAPTAGEVLPSGRAAAARPDPAPDPPQPDLGALALVALEELLRRRDEAVASGRPDGWPDDDPGAGGSFDVVVSLPLTRFESSVVPDSVLMLDQAGQAVPDAATAAEVAAVAGAGGTWQARVETLYELAAGPAVVRTDTVQWQPATGASLTTSPTATPGDGPGPATASGWQTVSWVPFPEQGEIGTAAPWDLGPVSTVVGERAVVLAWDGADGPDGSDGSRGWGTRVAGWADNGAVTVDSYLGTDWPRLSLVLVPQTPEQYAALVPGPPPVSDDVFAAVTTDVATPDGGGDVVVLNPAARAQLVAETWQVTVTHELVHVASGAIHGDGQEIWLAEGLADVIGWSGVVPGAVDRDVVAARLIDRVADGEADLSDLPDADDFTATDADVVGDAYEGSWLAVLLLEDEVGTEVLLSTYAAASEGDGTARERADVALRATTGQGRDAFRTRWAAYLDELAADSR